MATTDIEKLVVQLSADVRGYQKSLDKARTATNRTARDIETRFGRMNKSISTIGAGFKSAFAGFGAGLASSLTVSAIGNMIKSVADLKDQAERAGTSAESLQALGFAARQSGAEVSDVVQALGILNKKVAEARQKQKGPLFELFAANNKKFSDDAVENLKTIAELFRNAKNEQDKFLIGQTGLGKGFQVLVPLLNEGANGIERMMGVARESGAVIEERLVKKAAEFDDAWTKAFDIFSTTGKAAIISIAEEIEKIIKAAGEFGELLERLIKLLPQVKIGEPLKLESTGGGILGLLFGQKDSKTFFGGTALDQAKQKFQDLQTQMDKLLETEQATAAPVIVLQAEIRRAREEVERLQIAFNNLGKTPNIQFGGPQTGPASSRFGGIPTVIPPGSGSGSDDIAKAIEKGLLAVLRKVEGGRDGPNAVNFKDTLGLRGNVSLVTMTVREVLALQSRMRADQRAVRPGELPSSALGEFQIVGNTLEGYVKKLGISLEENFGPALQEKVASAIIADQVKAAGGNTDKLVELLREQFEGLKGLSKDQILQAVANSTDAIAEGTESLERRNTVLADMIAKEQQGADLEKLKASLLKASTGEQEKQVKLQELKNDLLQQGIKFEELSPDLQAKLVGIAETTGQAAQATEDFKVAQDAAAESAKALAEAQEEAAQTAQAVANAFGSAFQGFISDLAHGKKLTDALRDALLRLGESLLNIALDNLLKGAGSGGGLLGGLFGGGGAGGGAGSLFGGLFHGGGVAGHGGHGRRVPALAFAGAPRYHGGGFAGLQQGEVPAILKRGEIIFPNMDAVRNAVSRQGNGAGGGIVQNNTFVSPSWKAAERSQNQIARTAGASLDRVRRTL